MTTSRAATVPVKRFMGLFNILTILTFHRFIPDTCAIPLPDYPYGMFFLTRREQMVAVFILAALVAGAGIRHVRLERMLPSRTSLSTQTLISP